MLTSLCRLNQSILKQKLGLIESLTAKHGSNAKNLYKTNCQIVKASIGQHIRHSMDHIELAVAAAASEKVKEIHFDLRERGGVDEHDMEAATARIRRVDAALEALMNSVGYVSVLDHQIQACFMLSGDSETEYMLPSTVAREMGFAAHHAIHHMAMIRVIATTDLFGLTDSDLPSDFGRAPSTVNYDHKLQAAQ